MLSDVVAVAGIITAPMVAGVVALVLHRQRLTHERGMHDRERLRHLLDEGARLQWQGRTAIVDAMTLPSDTDAPTKKEAEDRILAMGMEFAPYVARLCLWLADDDPVVVNWRKLHEQLGQFIGVPPGPRSEYLRVLLPDFDAAAAAWIATAREMTRARLDD